MSTILSYLTRYNTLVYVSFVNIFLELRIIVYNNNHMSNLNEQEKEKMLSTEEVANTFNKSKATIYRWIRERKINAIKIGRDYLFEPEEIKRIIKENQTYNMKNAS